MVYFIQVQSKGPIKIGSTVNLEKRFKTIQGCNHERLEVIATIPGSNYLENKIHRVLKDHRIHGEWFKPNEIVLNYIKDIQLAEYETLQNRPIAVIWRDEGQGRTDHCPFCGARHYHGTCDGHRIAHCNSGRDKVYAKDGTVLLKTDGLILKTRFKEKNV